MRHAYPRHSWHRRWRLAAVFFASAFLLLVTGRPVVAMGDNPPRPNIVLIMADDMGFSDLGCYGGEIRTPNLDRLAANGLRFTQFYNAARCCPTRASLLTGLYPHQAGIGHMTNDLGFDGYRGDLNGRCVTVAEVLGAAGYRTYMSGKWHLTKEIPSPQRVMEPNKYNWPLQRGFHRYYGTIHGANSYFDPVVVIDDNEPTWQFPEDYYYTEAISDAAVRFIEEHAEHYADRPFFLYVAHTAPHWPLHALPEDIERYRGRYDAGWDTLRAERHQRMVEMGLVRPQWDIASRNDHAPAWEATEYKAWHTRRMEVYAAQVDRMDQGIGRLVDTLRDRGMLDDTLVLFLSDNGGAAEEISLAWRGALAQPVAPKVTADGSPILAGNDPMLMPGGPQTYQSYGLPWAHASNTPFREFKRWTHEGGIATPFIAHWPNGIRRRGELDHQIGHLIDFMATCVELAGAEYPTRHFGRPIHSMEGVSLVPAFEGRDISRQEAIFFEHEGHRAVRDGRWKLVATGPKLATEAAQIVLKAPAGPWELYDMDADRTETRDLADQHPDRVERMAAQWQQWAERTHVLPWPWREPQR